MTNLRLPLILGLLVAVDKVACQPVNDNCAQAQPLVINGPPRTGTSVDATQETWEKDVVYSFVGNGRTVRISTSFDETDTPHRFFLRNGNCGAQSFGQSFSPSEFCPNNQNAAIYDFDSVNGRVYPIIIAPPETGDTGNFALQVTDYENPQNDYCAQAQPLLINGQPVMGTTVNATMETWADDVVYSVVGTGETLRVSTCFDATDTPHRFFLRNGNCGAQSFGTSVSDPTCLSNANAAAVEFDSVEGRVYPIIVAPRQVGIEGNFMIAVSVAGAPPSPSPITPMPVNSMPTPVGTPSPTPIVVPTREPLAPPPSNSSPDSQACNSGPFFGGMLMDVLGAQIDYVVTACRNDQDGSLSNLQSRGWEGLKICPTGSCSQWDEVAGCATILGDTSQYGNWSPDQWTACPGQILNTFMACGDVDSSVLVVKEL